MSIREKLNEKPQIALAFAGVAAVIVFIVIYANSGNIATQIASKMYYSDDDGKTYFADATNKIFPFDHEGKQAFRATVMKGNGAPYVAFLTRYSDSVRNQLLALEGKSDPDSVNKRAVLASSGLEVKKPGSGTWVAMANPEAGKVMQPVAPDGSPAHEVTP
ncbi:MAG: hypothetical protein ACTHLN_05900 [Tepidisphaeraceae bacterium]